MRSDFSLKLLGKSNISIKRKGKKKTRVAIGAPACMYVWYSKSKDQPGKVGNPARGQLNRENEYFPVPVRT